MTDIGILGGGISGLSLAAFLSKPAEVLEATERVGGLARTFGRAGFSSDIGGHIMFSKDKEVLDLMVAALGGNVAQRRRANVILYDGAYVKYPFENGLSGLPKKQDILECVDGFVRAWHLSQTPEGRARPPAKDLREWCYRTFGPGIAEKYLVPYNEKIWKRRCEEIGTDWVDRVPQPPLEDVLKSAIGIETEGYTHQLYFHYPVEGGIESLPRAFAAQARERGHSLRTGFRVSSVKGSDGAWLVSDGREERRYRTLVSTMPILPFLSILDGVPAHVLEAARALEYNSLRVVLLGVRAPGLDRFTAVYVPDRRFLFHRVCFNNAFSPRMAPEGHSSVMVEITCREGDEVTQLSDEALADRVVAQLEEGELVPRGSVMERVVHKERYGYVVYDHGYQERVRTVREYLLGRGIHLAGRFAEYRYVNMDACVRRALDLSRELNAPGQDTRST